MPLSKRRKRLNLLHSLGSKRTDEQRVEMIELEHKRTPGELSQDEFLDLNKEDREQYLTKILLKDEMELSFIEDRIREIWGYPVYHKLKQTSNVFSIEEDEIIPTLNEEILYEKEEEANVDFNKYEFSKDEAEVDFKPVQKPFNEINKQEAMFFLNQYLPNGWENYAIKHTPIESLAHFKKHIPVEEETTVTIYMMLIRFKK